MASLSHEPGRCRWRIQFIAPDGSRRSIAVKETRARDKGQSQAAALKGHVEELLTCLSTGTNQSPVLARWITSIPQGTRKLLEKSGLLEPQTEEQQTEATIGAFLEQWFADRSHVKRATFLSWRNCKNNVLKFFGADTDLQDVTENDAERYERWLRGEQGLSEATVRKRLAITKQFFESARKARLIEANPFNGLKTSAVGNTSRQYFVTQKETGRLLEACSSQEWRVCVVLARYGALRIPSEISQLRWTDINWEHSCFRVVVPKLEHHADKGERIVPLFPEIRRELDLLWENPPDNEYVLPSIRHTQNCGPTMKRMQDRAGLKPWPKAWQNLRASRATELEEMFSASKAAAICGHAEKIARKHYWMVTADDITAMAQHETTATVGAHRVQYPAATSGIGSQEVRTAKAKSPEKPGFASRCDKLLVGQMGRGGLERCGQNAEKTATDTEWGAHRVHWSDLRELIAVCSDLPEAFRQELISQGDRFFE